jgi:adenylate cyclase
MRIDGQFTVDPTGASQSLQLFEIGGLGEPFNLSLPVRSRTLTPLPQPLPVHFTVLEEKFVGRTVLEGRLTAVSDLEWCLQTDVVLTVLSNLKLTVAETLMGNPSGEVYAKVTAVMAGTPGQTRIRFTSVSPEFKAWVQQSVDRPAAAEAARS